MFIKIPSSLTWRQSKKCKIFVWNESMFGAPTEKQPCRNVSKINSSLEATIKVHFSMSLFYTWGDGVHGVHLWWSAILSKFACNALQPWTIVAKKLHVITTLINAKQKLLQNTSRKLLLCLEAVVRRCSSNRCS